MSPNVGNFVHDLVEMAKAMETLPQVERKLSEAEAAISDLSQSVQDRELAIINYKTIIDSLNEKVRATEAERDDAELRFLELDEKAHKVLAYVSSIQAAALVVQESLIPPKPQPEPEPVKQEEVHPEQVDDPRLPDSSVTMEGDRGGTFHETTQSPASQGQGEGNPTMTTANTGETQTNAGHSPVTNSDVGSSVAGEDDGGDKSGPYANKYYSDHQVYVSLLDWLAGGGSEDKYYPKAVRDERI